MPTTILDGESYSDALLRRYAEEERNESKYNRVTCAGYNTGKVIIGSCYMPKPRKMSYDEHEIQDLLLTQRPSKRVLRNAARRLALWVSKGIGKAQQIAQRAAK